MCLMSVSQDFFGEFGVLSEDSAMLYKVESLRQEIIERSVSCLMCKMLVVGKVPLRKNIIGAGIFR